MQERNPYKHVIYRGNDEPDETELVNSFRFRSKSGNRYKKWSPDISTEERFKKKREREDKYIQNLNKDEKPILLIKNKHVYKNLKNPEIFATGSGEHESFLKVSKNTEVIPDIDKAIANDTSGIRKLTYIHDPNKSNADPFSLNAIYKIEGIEFLPEGFLELEPLLYKDEYDFENEFHEKLFEDEQRKYKSMRRKQYAQKEQKKKREVTIFVVDQYKDHLTDYLDEWYARNHRRMTSQEIDYVAKVLNTDPSAFAHLQDVYLEKKKATNARKLKEFLMEKGIDRTDRINSLPSHIRRYFIDRDASAIRRANSHKPSAKASAIKKLVEDYDKDVSFDKNRVQNPSLNSYSQTQSISNKSSAAKNLDARSSSQSKLRDNQRDSRVSNSKTSSTFQRNHIESKSQPKRLSENRSDVMAFEPSKYDELGNLINSGITQSNSAHDRKTTNSRNSKSNNYAEIYNTKYSEQSQLQPDNQTVSRKISELAKDSNSVRNNQIQNRQSSADGNPNMSQKFEPGHHPGRETRQNTQTQGSITRNDKSISKNANPERNTFTASETGEAPEERDIHMYYDTEISTILDRIRNTSYSSQNKLVKKNARKLESQEQYQMNSSNQGKLSLPSKKSSSRNTPDVPKTAKLIDQIASDVLARDKIASTTRPQEETITILAPKSGKKSVKSSQNISDTRSPQNSNSIRMSSQLHAYEADPFDYKERSGAELTENRVMRMSSQLKHYNENPYGYKNPGLAMLDKNSEEIEIFVGVDSHGREKQTADFRLKQSIEPKLPTQEEMNYSLSNKKSVFPFADEEESLAKSRQSSINDKLETHANKRSSIVNRSSSILGKISEVKRITIAAKSSRGESVVSQKLRPTLIGNQYYYQIIDDIIDSKGNRKSFVTVKNENGEVIGQQQVSSSQLGSFHHSAVVLNEDPKTRQSQISLLVRNENGETVAITPINLNDSQVSLGGSVSGVFGPQGDRRSTVVSQKNGDELIIIHNLKPIVLGNEFYRQTVTEVRKPSSTKLTITTLNENGEVISKSKVSPDLAGQSYLSFVADEQIDDDNTRKITLNTLNNKGQLILQQSFTTQLEDILEDYKAVALLEEVEDEKGGRTLTIVERNPTKNKLTTQKQLRASILGEDYYIDVTENEVDISGKHSFTVSAKNSVSGKVLAQKTANSKTNALLNEYLNDLKMKAEMELGKELSSKESIILRPMTEEYFLEIVNENANNQQGKRSVSVVAKDVRGKTLVQKTIEVSDSVKIDSLQFVGTLTDIENDIDAKRTASIAKKSVLNNRISKNIRRSKLISVIDAQEQWNTFNDDQNQSSSNQNRKASTKKSLDAHQDVPAEGISPFQTQNIYYRRLLNDLTLNQNPQRNSTPVVRVQGTPAVETKKKANIISLASKERPKSSNRLSSTSGSANYDKNKSTVDLKNEFEIEPIHSRNKTVHSQAIDQKSNNRQHPSVSKESRQNLTQAQQGNFTPKTSLKSNMSNNSVVLSQFQKPNRIGQIYSERHSVSSRQSESKSPFNVTPKHSTTNSIHQESLANSFRNSEAHMNNSERNLKITERNSRVSDNNFRPENHQSWSTDQKFGNSQDHSQTSRHKASNSKEEILVEKSHRKPTTETHDSFNPRDSIDGQTNELIEKSQALKGYLDDYINTLSNVRGKNHPPKEQQHSEVQKEAKRPNFNKEKSPVVISNVKPAIPKERIRIAESDERELRERVQEVFEQEKGKLGSKVLQRVKEKIEEDSKNGKGLMDEFYEFCERELPQDQKYKDSIMLISLFYYFLEKKNLIK